MNDARQSPLRCEQVKVVKKESTEFCQEIFANGYAAVSTKIYEALDQDPHSEIFDFCNDFSKHFDKISHYKLIQNLIDIEVGGCLREKQID